MPDPQPLKLYLQDFFEYSFNDAADAHWHHVRFALIDVEEMQEFSDFRMAYLARYGRQSMLQWDDVPVSRINELYTALKKIVAGEGDNSIFENS